MPNYTATFPSGEVMSLYALDVFEADDEFYAIVGDYPETIREEV